MVQSTIIKPAVATVCHLYRMVQSTIIKTAVSGA